MDRKLFIGATAVTVAAVGGFIYYRHYLLKHPRPLLDDTDDPRARYTRFLTPQEENKIEEVLAENDRLETLKDNPRPHPAKFYKEAGDVPVLPKILRGEDAVD